MSTLHGGGYVSVDGGPPGAADSINHANSLLYPSLTTHSSSSSTTTFPASASSITAAVLSAHSSPLDRSPPSAAACASGSADDENTVYKVYASRWLVLFVFALLTITNAMLWIAFAPIQSLAAAYYSVSNSSINMLSISFMALYLPGYFLAFWSMQRPGGGLRWGMCLAAVIQTVGAWVRVLSVIGVEDNVAPHPRGYILLLLGQCLAAVAQPMFTNAPARMSADWFGSDQRNLATTIAAMSNPIGIAVGQLLPTSLVSDSGGMDTLLYVSAITSTATMVLCFLCVKKEPPTPPSRSTAERRATRAASLASPAQHEQGFWRSPLIMELRSLLSNRHFLILLIGVGIGLGLFNAVSTLIEQLVRPSGYSKDDAGNFGALLIGMGLVGAGIVGPVMDKTHKYNLILKVGLLAALGGTVFLLLALRPGHFALLAVAFGTLGGVMLPLLPVCMECAAECTYPVSEDASSGLMLFAGNAVGILMILLVGELIQDPYEGVVNPAAICLTCFLVLAVAVVGVGYNGPLRRQEAERARSTGQVATSANSDGLESQLLI